MEYLHHLCKLEETKQIVMFSHPVLVRFLVLRCSAFLQVLVCFVCILILFLLISQGSDSLVFLDLLRLPPVPFQLSLSALLLCQPSPQAPLVQPPQPLAQGMLERPGSTREHVLAKGGATGHGGRRTLACTFALTVLPPRWERALQQPAAYLSS